MAYDRLIPYKRLLEKLGLMRGRSAGAHVYRIHGRFVVHCNSRTVAGIGIADEPFITLEADTGTSEIGRAIREALRCSKVDVPEPSDWKDLLRPLLKAAGVRSHREFQRNASYCVVVQQGGLIHFTPTRNGGTKGDGQGFHFLQGLQSEVSEDVDDEAIGRAVLDALDKCV
jgi:hypothetical protein